jgi:hypothetical protein
MQFYHDIITKKSFEYLQQFRRKHKFILIGGWAVFLYSKALKSKDIDIIIDYDELAKLKELYEVRKNERLRKYEISEGNFDIDIYVPHYSELGIDIAEIIKNSVNKEGFTVSALEILFLLKLYVWLERRGSSKGQKDELDIFCLAMLPQFNWRKYLRLVKELKFFKYHKEFIKLLKNTREIRKLAVNEQKMAKIRKNILAEIKEV